MRKFKFKKIDGFADGTTSGNPAGCIYLNDINDISEDEMQQIAAELKGFINEVVYIYPEGDTYFLRFFSSECEIDFCGHGTIAMMYDIIKNDKDLINQYEVRIIVKDESLTVWNEIIEDDSVYISAPQPEDLAFDINTRDIADALDIEPDIIDKSKKIDFIHCGLKTLIVPIINIKSCLNIFPDKLSLNDFCLKNDVDIVLIFTDEAVHEGNDYRIRVFAPKYGYLEDPATGSGNSAFGYYLIKEGLWDGSKLSIEQNNNLENPNIIKLSMFEIDGERFVIFGGGAVVRIEGEYILHT